MPKSSRGQINRMSEAVTAEMPAASAPQGKAAAKAPQAKSIEAPSASERIAELRVTAHLMTLETGLYCVFPTPGSPDQDQAPGLPGVRVTQGAGNAGRREA